MASFSLILLAGIASHTLAVVVPVHPSTVPMMASEQAERADALLNAANVTWFRCPLAGRVTNMMVTLADGITYSLPDIVTMFAGKTVLVSPSNPNLPIPRSLAFAFANLDLMDVIKDAGTFLRSLVHRQVPDAIRRWIPSPEKDRAIWICRHGRSRISSSFERPYEIHASGMQLVFTDVEETCFRNLHLERIVNRVCAIVDCRTVRSPGFWRLPGGQLLPVGHVSRSGRPCPVAVNVAHPPWAPAVSGHGQHADASSHPHRFHSIECPQFSINSILNPAPVHAPARRVQHRPAQRQRHRLATTAPVAAQQLVLRCIVNGADRMQIRLQFSHRRNANANAAPIVAGPVTVTMRRRASGGGYAVASHGDGPVVLIGPQAGMSDRTVVPQMPTSTSPGQMVAPMPVPDRSSDRPGPPWLNGLANLAGNEGNAGRLPQARNGYSGPGGRVGDSAPEPSTSLNH